MYLFLLQTFFNPEKVSILNLVYVLPMHVLKFYDFVTTF